MFDVSLVHYLLFAAVLFCIGLFGILVRRRNLLLLLLCVELLLLASGINFVAFSCQKSDVSGHVFALLVFAMTAAESVIGLAIFVLVFHSTQELSMRQPSLKG